MSNPLKLMEDPLKHIVLDVVSRLSRDYIVRSVDVERMPGEIRVTVVLKPRSEGATISAWHIVEMEERLASALGIEVELSHSRVGVNEEGNLVLVYILKSSEIAALE